ncbi:hypothetical protein NDU88_001760 [Pleurodeles waltl]|uniref:Uncharacterized protein n=1 Tax=Pleurodeles waltl TaxID=8319 RepID=A0AAV7T0E5_PLEWA|nr:hypothetical protein NDU88_001760 [Pleurodeles waltl]
MSDARQWQPSLCRETGRVDRSQLRPAAPSTSLTTFTTEACSDVAVAGQGLRRGDRIHLYAPGSSSVPLRGSPQSLWLSGRKAAFIECLTPISHSSLSQLSVPCRHFNLVALLSFPAGPASFGALAVWLFNSFHLPDKCSSQTM